jgi:hypothetical protein
VCHAARLSKQFVAHLKWQASNSLTRTAAVLACGCESGNQKDQRKADLLGERNGVTIGGAQRTGAFESTVLGSKPQIAGVRPLSDQGAEKGTRLTWLLSKSSHDLLTVLVH